MKKTILITLLAFIITSAKAQWQQTTIPPGGSIWSLASMGTKLIAGTGFGIYFSADGGTTWVKQNTITPDQRISSLLVNGSDIYAGTEKAVYKSADTGLTWIDVTPTQGSSISTYSLAIAGTYLYAGASGGGGNIFRTPLSGISTTSWAAFNSGLPNVSGIRSLAICGTTILAGTYGKGVWRSPIDSAQWDSTSGMASDGDYIQSLSVKGSTIFAGNISGTPVLYRSTDNGATWNACTISTSKPVYSIFHHGTTIYTGTEKEGVFSSNDDGVTWNEFNTGFKKDSSAHNDSPGTWYCNHINLRSFALIGNTLYGGTDCGVWKNVIQTTGMSEAYESTSASIYPNPSSGLFSVTTHLNNLHIDVINTIGQKVYTGKINSGKTVIDLKNVPKGVYLYCLQGEKGLTKTGKLIVE